MSAILLTIHIIACVVLIVLVLLQSGKEGMGVIFGGGSGSVFGSSGAGGLLVKITSYTAAVFLITSLAYNYYSSSDRRASASVMQSVNIEDIKPKAASGDAASGKDAAPGAQAPASPASPASKEAPKPAVTFEDVRSLPKPGTAAPGDPGVVLPGAKAAPEIPLAPQAQSPAKPAETPKN